MGRQRTRERHGREARRAEAEADRLVKMTQPLHNVPTYELLDEAGLEKIDQAALEILSEVGVDFYDEEARDILRQHGVRLKGDTAFFDPAIVKEYAAKAPSQFTQIARNPANNVVIGGNHICFAPVYGPPFVHDLDRGRRDATLEDFQNFVKLAYLSPYIHHSGGTIVEPTDEPAHTRHLDMIYSHIKYSDKAFMGSVMSAANAADSVKMAEIVFGAAAIQENPALLSLINISSPRRLDDRMLGALKVYAKARQAVIITPFLFSGAMAPVGIAGTLVQLHAEALSGIVFAQMVNPGTPVVYGAFQTNIDLQSGAPVFGSPESQLTLYGAAQLARRYKLPFRSGGMFASSKIPDSQAAYESVMVMLPAILARVNFVLHAAGWLEGGLTAGYEKFVLDCQLLGMYQKFMQGLDLSENGMAMESLRTVPTSGHHLGTDHTMQNFRTAFYRTELFDYNSFEQWQEEGGLSAAQRANAEYKKLLASYQPPELDPTVDEALQAFMTQRKAEIKPEY
ncbi:MAG: trimethylamine methyltransferase family protein [Ardenticatenaceae bacterium]|nr:trimethylamine methyltransferase family protein [Ardenticatenaceae bacterium]MCB9442931.1 trimethylamine methyltransferase family protein [Ardenticatenaceae bacterium]